MLFIMVLDMPEPGLWLRPMKFQSQLTKAHDIEAGQWYSNTDPDISL
jgi:hypothetical protein